MAAPKSISLWTISVGRSLLEITAAVVLEAGRQVAWLPAAQGLRRWASGKRDPGLARRSLFCSLFTGGVSESHHWGPLGVVGTAGAGRPFGGGGVLLETRAARARRSAGQAFWDVHLSVLGRPATRPGRPARRLGLQGKRWERPAGRSECPAKRRSVWKALVSGWGDGTRRGSAAGSGWASDLLSTVLRVPIGPPSTQGSDRGWVRACRACALGISLVRTRIGQRVERAATCSCQCR